MQKGMQNICLMCFFTCHSEASATRLGDSVATASRIDSLSFCTRSVAALARASCSSSGDVVLCGESSEGLIVKSSLPPPSPRRNGGGGSFLAMLRDVRWLTTSAPSSWSTDSASTSSRRRASAAAKAERAKIISIDYFNILQGHETEYLVTYFSAVTEPRHNKHEKKNIRVNIKYMKHVLGVSGSAVAQLASSWSVPEFPRLRLLFLRLLFFLNFFACMTSSSGSRGPSVVSAASTATRGAMRGASVTCSSLSLSPSLSVFAGGGGDANCSLSASHRSASRAAADWSMIGDARRGD